MKRRQCWENSLDMEQLQVANYESGYRLPDLLTAYVIAQHYHVLLEELIEEHHES